jgi:hypothetical protein
MAKRCIWIPLGIAFWITNIAQAQQPTPPASCAPAIAAATSCTLSSQCPTGQICTLDYNQQIKHAWTSGHCLDPSGKVNAQPAVQADLCTLPIPYNFSAGVLYNLPGQSRIRIESPGLIIYRHTILAGNGALLVLPNQAPWFTALRVVVPLDGEFIYEINGKHASFSAVEDLAITPDANILPNPLSVPNQHIGLQVAAHGVRLFNIQIHRLGKCIEVYGEGGHANSNATQSYSTLMNNCWGYGERIRGGDSNGGVFIGEELIGGVGLRDSAFLGNLHLGPMVQGNDKVSNSSEEGPTPKKYSLDFSSGNYSTIVHPYIELSEAKPLGTWTNLIAGGQAVARWELGERVGGQYSRLVFRNQTSDRRYKFILGRETEPMFWQAYTPDNIAAEPYGHRLEYRPEFDAWQIGSEAFVPAGLGSDRYVLRFRTSKIILNAGIFSPGPKLTPLSESGLSMCTDGIDNDGDTKIDALDPGCSP